jgi:hypothetical protein
MIRPALLMAMIVVSAQAGAEGVRPPIRYVATVSFADGACRYWTGDTMVDAAGFRRDLRRRFDRRSGMTIVHAADVPARCTTEAQDLVRKAGFTDVRLELGRVGPVLP